MKKIKIILLIFVFTFCFFTKARASVVTLVPAKTTVDQNEQFYVDVMLDPEGVSQNGVEGSVTFGGGVSLVRAETGQSLINFWIEQPKLTGNTISFAGIIPTGFAGVIDPFNPEKKLPGRVLRLVFVGNQAGLATFSSAPFSLTLNDGQGTTLETGVATATVNIDNFSNPFAYKNEGDLSPALSAFVTRDPNLFNNRYALIFEARDSETGIKDVMIKEGNRDWKKIESPYLLEDQSRHSLIALEAVNFSGASIVIVINPVPRQLFSSENIVWLVIFLVLLFFIIKKIYERRKRKKQEKIQAQ